MPLTEHQRRRAASYAKGLRLERAIKAYLEAQGWLIETAPKVVIWKWVPAKGAKVPMSRRHDLFGIWDGIAVGGIAVASTRWCYQVTTLTHLAHKRRKILLAGFPVTAEDRIYAYVGRPAKWRVFYGPDFDVKAGQSFTCAVPRNLGGNHGGHDHHDPTDPNRHAEGAGGDGRPHPDRRERTTDPNRHAEGAGGGRPGRAADSGVRGRDVQARGRHPRRGAPEQVGEVVPA